MQTELLGPESVHSADSVPGEVEGRHRESPEADAERFAKLLIEYYAHGLAQAKRSSVASMISSGVGLVVLVGGITMAILGSVAPAVIVTLSGIITNGIGILFHQQGDKALQHMELQTLNLRSDMRSERDSTRAIELMDNVDDSRLRDQLRTAVILRLADAPVQSFMAQTRVDLTVGNATSDSVSDQAANGLVP
ncbi:hypothetical protein [Streptomyces sp. SID13031]|uniref:TRADD-N-associated membrane domain-containing protein n=1 Tax=Streptomyces sp. SID13031 TaxID=2706046 RepID=UPI0013CB9116|nr:hypothetical protein [Streptomyces sp. SID13031]NEA34317.1 hypothetical protein [Streptomyces sp. SID13031]